MIRLYSVGGFLEVGRNMSILEVDDIAIVIDMGLHMDNYVSMNNRELENINKVTIRKLLEHDAIPNIKRIKDFERLKRKVKAIVIGHAHLDHLGAVIFLESMFNAKIISTPFTIEVLRSLASDDGIKIKNKLIKINPNDRYKISKDITIELVNITHSTPQTSIVVIHTRYGSFIYANDFKIDLHPTLGKKANLERLEQISKKEKVLALVIDVLYADHYGKTPSESVAHMMLRDIFFSLRSEGLIIATTFSSHIERIMSIIKLAKQIKRKVIILGRSMDKYIKAAIKSKVIRLPKEIRILKFQKQIKKAVERINKDKQKYLIICTGSQGEEGSILRRIADQDIELYLDRKDHVIFSCSVVPTETNIMARKELEEKLEKFGVRIFKDVHSSGHAYREDLRDMIRIIKPNLIIPAHAEIDKVNAFVKLAEEEGYKLGKNIIVMKNGNKVELDHPR